MGKPLSIPQVVSFISVLFTNLDWNRVAKDDVQAIINAASRIDPLFQEFIRKTAAKLRESAGTTSSVLEFVGLVTVSATTSKFAAKDNFVLETRHDTPLRVGDIDVSFATCFLNGDGKIEDPIGERTLSYARLCRTSADAPIIAALGGDENSETTLSEMFSLAKKQERGEEGVLLSDGLANIFYIRDGAGVLRAVGVRWCNKAWFISALPVEHPSEWQDGSRVFYRNPVLESSETSVSSLAQI